MSDLKERIAKAFTAIKVKDPFSTAPELKTYAPSDKELDGVIFRLKEVWTDQELATMDEQQLERAIKRVWELVRWIHYD